MRRVLLLSLVVLGGARAQDVSRLGDPDLETRERAHRALLESGARDPRPVEAALEDSDPEVRRRAREIVDQLARTRRRRLMGLLLAAYAVEWSTLFVGRFETGSEVRCSLRAGARMVEVWRQAEPATIHYAGIAELSPQATIRDRWVEDVELLRSDSRSSIAMRDWLESLPVVYISRPGRPPLVSTLDEVLRDPATLDLLAGIAAEGDPLLQPRARDLLASLTGAADPGEPGLDRWLRDHRTRFEWNDSLGRFVPR